MTEKETLILVIARYELDQNLIPPLKIVIPMLDNLYPVRVFTSNDGEIIAPRGLSTYQELVKKLEGNTGFCCLTKTLEEIIKDFDTKDSKNYRICILGHERVDWSVVMEFKRRNIIVDTLCSSVEKNQLLVQISYITGGIHKTVKEGTIVRAFQTELGINSKMRSFFKVEKKDPVTFTLKCFSCNAEIDKMFLSCSVCLTVYCSKHTSQEKCLHCDYLFD